jgi:hypothetical protein
MKNLVSRLLSTSNIQNLAEADVNLARTFDLGPQYIV